MAFDKPIILQVQDLETEKWTDHMTLHAQVNKTGGGVSTNAGADQYQVRLTFEVRYSAKLAQVAYGVQPYRILYRGHKFKVVDYDDYMEQHRKVKLFGVLYA